MCSYIYSHMPYLILVLVEVVDQFHYVRMLYAQHYLQLTVFVLLVLVDVLDGHFLIIIVHVSCLYYKMNQCTRYTVPNVPLPIICSCLYFLPSGLTFSICLKDDQIYLFTYLIPN